MKKLTWGKKGNKIFTSLLDETGKEINTSIVWLPGHRVPDLSDIEHAIVEMADEEGISPLSIDNSNVIGILAEIHHGIAKYIKN